MRGDGRRPNRAALRRRVGAAPAGRAGAPEACRLRGMGDFVGVESRAAGSRGARVAAARAERAAERQKAERRAKVSCHRATVNGAEGGVPEEGDRVAFEWKFDEGGLFHECLARARREGQ